MDNSVEAEIQIRASTLATGFSLQIFESQDLPGSLWYRCEAFFYTFKLGCSDILEGPNASWQYLIKQPMSMLKCKEIENNRSYKYEYLDIVVYEHAMKHAQGTLFAVGRIPLSEVHVREPKWIRLTLTSSDEVECGREYAGKILVNMTLQNLASHEDITPPKFIQALFLL